ncbi:MAG: hypothetical protein ACRYF5_08485, partial [Janthinobacterium lividum]
MPNFDARSFLITLLFAGTVCGMVFCSLRRGFPKAIEGIGDWAWACLAVVLGTALITAREMLVPSLGVVLPNILVSGGVMLMLTGLRKFSGVAPQYRSGAAVMLVYSMMLW